MNSFASVKFNSMSRLPLIVLADDLTGAAEIAAIAHNAGLRAVVYTTPPNAHPVDADVLIFDTDTRLSPPAQAARRVRGFVNRLKKLPHAGLFKKTDSVLRGPVLAELAACASALGRKRTLLVPCNPSLGRIIRDGRYLIAGKPLHTTAFARDPHHPRATSIVLTLLGDEKKFNVTCHPPSSRLPRTGIIVGEATSPADVTVWAGQVDANTLPAGGADFFRVWLQTRRAYREPSRLYRLPEGAVFLINGTIAAPEPISPFPVDLVGVGARRPSSVKRLVARIQPQLFSKGFAAVTTQGPVVRKTLASTTLTRTFVGLAKELHAAGAFRHLLVAGGATAAGVLHKLKWSQFEVVHVWGPGVVTLQPTAAPEFAVTMKPGSYPWPASLSRELDPAQASSLHEQPSPRFAHAG